MVDKEYRDRMSDLAVDAANTSSTAPLGQLDQKDANEATHKQALDARIGQVESFVSVGRTKLNDIDLLLSGDSK
jgi:hypothetical protein